MTWTANRAKLLPAGVRNTRPLGPTLGFVRPRFLMVPEPVRLSTVESAKGGSPLRHIRAPFAAAALLLALSLVLGAAAAEPADGPDASAITPADTAVIL
jgi:hypothetical protein